jgi:hypothetical protein
MNYEHTKSIYLKVMTIAKPIDHQSQHYSSIILSNNNPIPVRTPSHQATRLARRHFRIYDCTRLSFYDNIPPPFGYLSEPIIIEDRSPTSTSSTDRKDSGLDTSSLERKIVLSDNLNRSLTSISSSSSNNSSSHFPTSRKIRVKWHSFTRTHRPSFNSSKYHLGQMSVGQLVALRRAASIRIQELFDIKRLTKVQHIPTVISRQCLLATAFSAVPKLIIRRHQQRKVCSNQHGNLLFFFSLNLLGNSS